MYRFQVLDNQEIKLSNGRSNLKKKNYFTNLTNQPVLNWLTSS
jgi:hypothetical protein